MAEKKVSWFTQKLINYIVQKILENIQEEGYMKNVGITVGKATSKYLAQALNALPGAITPQTIEQIETELVEGQFIAGLKEGLNEDDTN